VKRLFLKAAIIGCIVLGQPALADADAEQTAKNLCAGCHGPDGVSTNPLWPNIAGQKAQYTAKQLMAFRAGTRADPSMNGLSQTLSDAQIDALAAYYASMPAAN